MIKLVCPECQRQNEPERIYCHDCGARLDRSALAKVAPKLEEPEETQRRLKRMLDPGRLKMQLLFFKISKTVLGAFVLAGLIQMLLAPEVPERVKNIELQQIGLDLEKATTSHGTPPLQYSETDVNGYLVNALKSKQAALSKLVQFERALAKFDENVCRITVERSLFGFSVFIATSHKVTLENGTLKTSNNGGSIGRLPIHPAVMEYGDILFGDVWAALERERKLVAKMGSIEFHPQLVVLNPRQRE